MGLAFQHRRNDDYRPLNENVIPVKTGIQKALSFKIVLRIAQFRFVILRPITQSGLRPLQYTPSLEYWEVKSAAQIPI